VAGTTVAGLVRVEGEDEAAFEIRRTLFHLADAGVAVLHRRGKAPVLEGRAHALELARRHAAAEDERLGAAADAAVERPHQHLAVAAGASGSVRISPRPGAATQNARASSGTGPF
jgi:hypothetical protein